MHGAPLLYNLMLAELTESRELVDDFRERLEACSARMLARAEELAAWDRERFWEIVGSARQRTPWPTRRFIDRWMDLVLGEVEPAEVPESAAARTLIGERERALKGGRARLHDRRALELWGGDSGTARFNYRWPAAQTIMLDISRGLKGGSRDARAA